MAGEEKKKKGGSTHFECKWEGVEALAKLPYVTIIYTRQSLSNLFVIKIFCLI